MSRGLILNVGIGNIGTQFINRNYYLIIRLLSIIESLNIDLPLVVTTPDPNAPWIELIDHDNLIVVSDERVEREVSREYAFFEKIRGYGKIRLCQYLLSPDGCLIRDQDTMELDENLIKHQYTEFERNMNNKMVVYSFSDYIGRGTYQYQDGNIPLDLNRLDTHWFNPTKKKSQLNAFLRGKYYQERVKVNQEGLFGWGNHGSCSISNKLIRLIPPLAGPIRGGDDSFPLRVLYKSSNSHQFTSQFLKWPVYHHIIPGRLSTEHIFTGLKTISQSILFNPYWTVLENGWKHTGVNNGAKKVSHYIKDNFQFENIEEELELKLNSVEIELENLRENSHPISQENTGKALDMLEPSELIRENRIIFGLTLELYENWEGIYDKFSPELFDEVIGSV